MRTLPLCLLALAFVPVSVWAQQHATVQGDILQGQGEYLKGLGSWELNEARAREIDAKTNMAVSNWYIQYYSWLQKRYNASIDRKDKNAQKRADMQKQRQSELRTNPTSKDVQNGEALNLLLTDLSSPKIAPSAWRLAKIPLPPSVSIRTLAFKFAEKEGAGATLRNSVIAIGRLDLAGHWPGYLPETRVGAERKSYEAAYKKLVEACEKNEDIMELAIALKKETVKLRDRAAIEIPKDGRYQEYAIKFSDSMKDAAKLFDAQTMDFARDFIADSHKREAETVGDLLSFMQKYRLYFAASADNTEMNDAYKMLYQLLKQQSEALEIKPEPEMAGGVQDPFKQFNGIWHGVIATVDGNTAESTPDHNWTIEFAGDKFAQKQNGEPYNSGTWTMDISKNPMEYTMTFEDGANAGKTVLGVMKWHGKDLIRCHSGIRPDQFVSMPGQGRVLIRFSRRPPR